MPENKLCEEVKIKVKLENDFEIVGSALVWNSFTFRMEDFCLSVSDGHTYAVACITKDGSERASEYTKSTGTYLIFIAYYNKMTLQ